MKKSKAVKKPRKPWPGDLGFPRKPATTWLNDIVVACLSLPRCLEGMGFAAFKSSWVRKAAARREEGRGHRRRARPCNPNRGGQAALEREQDMEDQGGQETIADDEAASEVAWFAVKVAAAGLAVNYALGPVVVIVFLAGWLWGARNLGEGRDA